MNQPIDNGIEFNCPHCDARVSADWEQISDAVECPKCHQPFQAPRPRAQPKVHERTRSFRFQCLRCGSVLEAEMKQSGRSGKCPSCGGTFIIPEMDPATGLARTNADPGRDGENPIPVHAYAAAGEHAPHIVRTADDQLFIECPRCGRQSPVNADNCAGCGLPFTLEGADYRVQLVSSNLGHAALILGIIAVPLSLCGGVGIIPGLLGLIFGVNVWWKERRMGPGPFGAILGFLGCMIGAGVWWINK